MGSRCAVVFTKVPRPGRVKTRLIGELTPDQACDLHAALLEDTLSRLGSGTFSLAVAWALEPGDELPPASPESVSFRQIGRDLGERLHHGLGWALRDHERVAAVGSDAPHLPLEALDRTFEALAGGADVVLGPATDGGFYLIALSAAALRPSLFEGIPWSSGEELAAMRERCRRESLRLEEVEPISDVDEPADLAWLTDLLRDGSVRCPATERLLGAWGRLAPAAS